MLKKTVTYVDFDDKEKTEDLYFHITKAELIEFVSQYPDDFAGYVKKISEANNKADLIAMFRSLIMRSYGIKDGPKFNKSAAISEEFSHSEAYSSLFLELFQKTDNLVDFFNAVLGVDISQLAAAQQKSK